MKKVSIKCTMLSPKEHYYFFDVIFFLTEGL